jgi:hypothetical protein
MLGKWCCLSFLCLFEVIAIANPSPSSIHQINVSDEIQKLYTKYLYIALTLRHEIVRCMYVCAHPTKNAAVLAVSIVASTHQGVMMHDNELYQ